MLTLTGLRLIYERNRRAGTPGLGPAGAAARRARA